MLIAKSSTPKAMNRAKRANAASKIFMVVALTACAWCIVYLAASAVLGPCAGLSQNADTKELLDYTAISLLALVALALGCLLVVAATHLAARSDLNERIILDADSVVINIRNEAKPGEYSDDSIFELQEGIDRLIRDWKVKNLTES